VAIVIDLPEWQKPKGLRRNLIDSAGAMRMAARNAMVPVVGLARQHWKVETLLVFGFGFVYLWLGEAPRQGGPPKVVTAFVIPAGALFAAALIAFLVLFFWEPFRDHRKLVWERKQREEQVRTIHLVHQANDWLLWTQNELSNIAPNQGLRTNPGYFQPNRVTEMIERLAVIRKCLREWGQPTLADQLPGVSVDRVTNVDDYRRELDRCRNLFLGWRSGRNLPPFSKDASEQGLHLPMLYMP
jgi:hypothetical protein